MDATETHPGGITKEMREGAEVGNVFMVVHESEEMGQHRSIRPRPAPQPDHVTPPRPRPGCPNPKLLGEETINVGRQVA